MGWVNVCWSLQNSVMCLLCFTVGSVHSGPTIQAIQGASLPSLSSQTGALVSTPFPAEDEQHSQPISQQGLHYLHSAYRVGEEFESYDYILL